MLDQVLPLALLDTVSISTLVIPLWFLMTPHRLRYRNVFLYLFLVATGYLLLGLLLMSGLSAARDQVQTAMDSAAADLTLAVVGVSLLLFAAWYGLISRSRGFGERRLTRWRDAAVGESSSFKGVLAVALTSVTLEIATMFPYLVAIDTLDKSGHSWITRALVLGLYCLVMIAPAALATTARMMSGTALTPALARINDWFRRNEREDTAWLLAIVGVLIVSSTDVFTQVMDTW